MGDHAENNVYHDKKKDYDASGDGYHDKRKDDYIGNDGYHDKCEVHDAKKQWI